jgi:hypothetical protein
MTWSREHRLQFVRRAGQHDEDLAVLLDPEAGRGAVGVGQHLAALEAVGLLEIVFGHLPAEGREAVGDVPARSPDRARASGRARRQLASRVRSSQVGPRPPVVITTSDRRPALAELRGDGVGLVGDRDVAREQRAAAAELRADEGEVAVGRQAEQELVAQGEQLVTQLRDRSARDGAWPEVWESETILARGGD